MTEHRARPDRGEVADYYFKYIDLVPEGDIVEILEEQQSLFRSIPADRGGHRYADGKWTLVEVLSHVNDCERLFVSRAFWFARGFDSELPSFDQEVAAAAARATEHPWSSHLEEFASLRASTIAFFRHLPDDAWRRSGVASGYPFSVRSLAWIAAGHVTHHADIVQRLYVPSFAVAR